MGMGGILWLYDCVYRFLIFGLHVDTCPRSGEMCIPFYPFVQLNGKGLIGRVHASEIVLRLGLSFCRVQGRRAFEDSETHVETDLRSNKE